MIVYVNGTPKVIDDDTTIEHLLTIEHRSPYDVTVVVNDEVKPYRDHKQALQEGDTIEFMYFMSGGSTPTLTNTMPLTLYCEGCKSTHELIFNVRKNIDSLFEAFMYSCPKCGKAYSIVMLRTTKIQKTVDIRV